MQFNFKTAFLHFRDNPDWTSFLIRYVFAFVVLSLILTVMQTMALNYAYTGVPSIFANMNAPNLPDSVSPGVPIWLINVIGYVVLWITFFAFEAAHLRFYMRGEKFRLQLGRDEWLMALVWVAWFVFLLILSILITLALMIPVLILSLTAGLLTEPTGGPSDSLSAVVIFLLPMVVICGLSIRLLPAAALTIRDREFRFRRAWDLTKGHYWPLCLAFGCWITIYILISLAILWIWYGIEIDRNFQTATFWNWVFFNNANTFGPFSVLTLATSAMMTFLYSGPAALLAKLDPDLSHD